MADEADLVADFYAFGDILGIGGVGQDFSLRTESCSTAVGLAEHIVGDAPDVVGDPS